MFNLYNAKGKIMHKSDKLKKLNKILVESNKNKNKLFSLRINLPNDQRKLLHDAEGIFQKACDKIYTVIQMVETGQ